MYFLLCDSVIKRHRGFLYNKFTRLGFGTFVFIKLKGTVRVILSKLPDKDKGFKGIIVNQSLLAFFAYNYAFSFFEQKLWGRGGQCALRLHLVDLPLKIARSALLIPNMVLVTR